jgi:hypothetical protein
MVLEGGAMGASRLVAFKALPDEVARVLLQPGTESRRLKKPHLPWRVSWQAIDALASQPFSCFRSVLSSLAAPMAVDP